jgi:hypothetical protein
MPHPFLSDEWFAAAQQVRDEAGDIAPSAALEVKLNVVVTGAPGGDQDVHLADGQFDRGHVPDAPTKATVPYEVARQVFVDGNPQAALQAFMAGDLRFEGDMTQLMAVQGLAMAPSPEQALVQQKLRDITA